MAELGDAAPTVVEVLEGVRRQEEGLHGQVGHVVESAGLHIVPVHVLGRRKPDDVDRRGGWGAGGGSAGGARFRPQIDSTVDGELIDRREFVV